MVASFSDAGEMLDSSKYPTPRDTDEYIQITARAISNLAGSQDASALCIAVPGPTENGRAIICKNLGWQDFDILGRFKEHFPNTPMWLENDANLGGVGATNLIEPTPRRCLYVTISTGVNGSLIVDKQLDPTTAKSEFGDISFEFQGKIVSWEEIAGGKAINDKYGKLASQLTDPNEIKDVAQRISRGLLSLLPTIQPDIVAMGGGIGAHYQLFADDINAELSALPKTYLCPIITAPHPEEIVAYGCYYYAQDKLTA